MTIVMVNFYSLYKCETEFFLNLVAEKSKKEKTKDQKK